ncbi:MAG: hypothetical protein MRY32_03675 [Rickettsiales bacterium]|nr:hypothetical protein [Rickettsiales bacterium]
MNAPTQDDFNTLIDLLKRDGMFQRYDTPRHSQEMQPYWDVGNGRAEYPGDTPYMWGMVSASKEISQASIDLTLDEGKTLITRYAPVGLLNRFTDDWLTRKSLDEEQNAQLHRSLGECAESHVHIRNLVLTSEGMKTLAGDGRMSHELFEQLKGDALRRAVNARQNVPARALQHEPEVMLAFAITHASYQDYFEQLKTTVGTQLQGDEQKIAEDNIRRLKNRFDSGIRDGLFMTIPPMLFFELQQATMHYGDEDTHEVPHEFLVDRAIRGAFKRLYDSEMFVREDAGKDGEPRKTECPAQWHLKLSTGKLPEAKDKVSMEHFDFGGRMADMYHHICAHRDQYKPLLDEIQQDIKTHQDRHDEREHVDKEAKAARGF